MPPRRLAPIAAPVRLTVDGDAIEAVRGEPVTVALTAAGRLTLGRSVKYHRPRGAACYVGRCDGCLMRVDGAPSVMTCRVPAADGMVVETQNVLGSARVDLLAATDWFFPDGMNHHEMFTWNEAVNKVMQKVARRIAGIGRIPDAALDPAAAPEAEVDVLVVGGGPAGLATATALAADGFTVRLVEESLALGGSLGWWPGASHDAAERRVAEAQRAGVVLEARRSAIGAFEPWESVAGADGPAPTARDARLVVLVAGPDGLERVRPRRLIVATGRHLGASAFGDADTPGVIELRGACLLLAHGVLPGERVALVGDGPLVDALGATLRAQGAAVVGPFAEADVVEADGRPAVEALVVREGRGTKRHRCDAVAVLPPTSAVYELAAQAGVPVAFSGTGYELDVGEAGATAAPDVRVVGWAAGARDASLDEVLAAADAVAAAVAKELRA